MAKRRTSRWLWLILMPVLPIVLIPVLWVIVSLTARPLYPNAESVPSVVASAPANQWTEAVEQGRRMVRRSVAEQNLPGLSVAVGVDGEIVWAEGFGFADLKSSETVTPNHRFRIGTASAALASAAAGVLIEDGRLRLDDEIQKTVRAFPKKQWPVTLRALMANTAGISDEGDGAPLFTKHCEQPSDAVSYFGGESLLFEPGTQYSPSIHGWILMSSAIETAAGQPFYSFVRERVFGPAGMQDTVADPSVMEPGEDFPLVNIVRELIYDPESIRRRNETAPKHPARNRVTSYATRFASDPNYGMHVLRPLDYSCYAGAGAFLSTPSDLVRFRMALDGGKLLRQETVEMLQTPQRLASGNETGFGLGWQVSTGSSGKRTARRDGDILGGRVATLLTFPDDKITVAVISNISFADTPAVAETVAEIFGAGGTRSAPK